MLPADVCTHLPVKQAFIPDVIGRCMHTLASQAGIYTCCYQQMYVHTCQSSRHLHLLLSVDDSTYLQVMQFVPLAWWQQGIQLSQ
jgi:hypothetical protein